MTNFVHVSAVQRTYCRCQVWVCLRGFRVRWERKFSVESSRRGDNLSSLSTLLKIPTQLFPLQTLAQAVVDEREIDSNRKKENCRRKFQLCYWNIDGIFLHSCLLIQASKNSFRKHSAGIFTTIKASIESLRESRQTFYSKIKFRIALTSNER